MKMFRGIRRNPPQDYIDKGITNGPNKPDYEGIVFSDGIVVVQWLTKAHSTAVFPSWDMFYEIHGHPEYGTDIQMSVDIGWYENGH